MFLTPRQTCLQPVAQCHEATDLRHAVEAIPLAV